MPINNKQAELAMLLLEMIFKKHGIPFKNWRKAEEGERHAYEYQIEATDRRNESKFESAMSEIFKLGALQGYRGESTTERGYAVGSPIVNVSIDERDILILANHAAELGLTASTRAPEEEKPHRLEQAQTFLESLSKKHPFQFKSVIEEQSQFIFSQTFATAKEANAAKQALVTQLREMGIKTPDIKYESRPGDSSTTVSIRVRQDADLTALANYAATHKAPTVTAPTNPEPAATEPKRSRFAKSEPTPAAKPEVDAHQMKQIKYEMNVLTQQEKLIRSNPSITSEEKAKYFRRCERAADMIKATNLPEKEQNTLQAKLNAMQTSMGRAEYLQNKDKEAKSPTLKR